MLSANVNIRERQPTVLAVVLGLTQILAWGSTYYLPAVLAQPIALDSGWSPTLVIGGLSIALLTAGLASPKVGRLIGRYGGRPVLAGGSVIFASGLLGVALAHSKIGYLAGWAVLGLAMAGGLYDAAFATLGRLYGANARAPITLVTIFAGFAGTICWPLSAVLLGRLGWRGACIVYAALHLILALPTHLLVVPAAPPLISRAQRPTDRESSSAREAPALAHRSMLFAMIATSFTLGAAITSVMTVHLLTILQAHGLSLSGAVTLGAIVGPSQVGARIYESVIGRRFHPTLTFILSGFLMAGGLIVLLLAFPLVGVGLVLYGGGVGIMTIARGTLPLALFGPSDYAILLGRLALPSLIAQAVAPAAAAPLLGHGAGASRTLAILAACSLINVVLIVALRVASVASATSNRVTNLRQ